MVSHLACVRKVVNDIRCTAPRAISDVGDNFRLKTLKSGPFLASFSTFCGHQSVGGLWGL